MSDLYRIGIDLGGTTVTAGLVDEENKILHKLTWATALPRPAEDLEQHMAKLCRAVAQQAGVDFAKVASIGIGTPGSVNSKTGKVGFNANFGYHNWDLGCMWKTMPTQRPTGNIWRAAQKGITVLYA